MLVEIFGNGVLSRFIVLIHLVQSISTNLTFFTLYTFVPHLHLLTLQSFTHIYSKVTGKVLLVVSIVASGFRIVIFAYDEAKIDEETEPMNNIKYASLISV